VNENYVHTQHTTTVSCISGGLILIETNKVEIELLDGGDGPDHRCSCPMSNQTARRSGNLKNEHEDFVKLINYYEVYSNAAKYKKNHDSANQIRHLASNKIQNLDCIAFLSLFEELQSS
jgi:hypothetical protein